MMRFQILQVILFGLAFNALAFSLILAAFNKCVQALLGSLIRKARVASSSLGLLFGDHHNDAEDLTLYSSNTQTGRDESEATYIPHETVLCPTEQIESQSDQRPWHPNHRATNDQEIEAELLRYRINALLSQNKILRRNLKKLQVENQENDAI
jgi:hypothetical protein